MSAKICCVCIILTSYRDKVVRGLRELAEDVKDEVEVATDVTLEISKHVRGM